MYRPLLDCNSSHGRCSTSIRKLKTFCVTFPRSRPHLRSCFCSVFILNLIFLIKIILIGFAIAIKHLAEAIFVCNHYFPRKAPCYQIAFCLKSGYYSFYRHIHLNHLTILSADTKYTYPSLSVTI